MSKFHITYTSPALADPALMIFDSLARIGFSTTIRQSNFDSGAMNIVLGAQLFKNPAVIPPGSIIFNLEQMRSGSAWVDANYIAMLGQHRVWDYSLRNIRALREDHGIEAVHVPLGYSAILERDLRMPDGPGFDVLFYGALNERRKQVLSDAARRGLSVHATQSAFFERRDALLSRTKMVANIHYYETEIFEIVRCAYLFANGIPIVSERGENLEVYPWLEGGVAWARYEDIPTVMAELARDPERLRRLGQAGNQCFREKSQIDILKEALELRNGRAASTNRGSPNLLPKKINLGSGKDYLPDYLNIDIQARWKPDLLADLSQAGALDRSYPSERFGGVKLPTGYFEEIRVFDVLEHIPDLVTFMENCLALLADGGSMHIKVPYDLAYGAWQDPTHVRAFNERSWLYYTEWYWYLGWRSARFDQHGLTYRLSPLGRQLKTNGMPVADILRAPRAIDEMELRLVKRPLTDAERDYVERYLQGR